MIKKLLFVIKVKANFISLFSYLLLDVDHFLVRISEIWNFSSSEKVYKLIYNNTTLSVPFKLKKIIYIINWGLAKFKRYCELSKIQRKLSNLYTNFLVRYKLIYSSRNIQPKQLDIFIVSILYDAGIPHTVLTI